MLIVSVLVSSGCERQAVDSLGASELIEVGYATTDAAQRVEYLAAACRLEPGRGCSSLSRALLMGATRDHRRLDWSIAALRRSCQTQPGGFCDGAPDVLMLMDPVPWNRIANYQSLSCAMHSGETATCFLVADSRSRSGEAVSAERLQADSESYWTLMGQDVEDAQQPMEFVRGVAATAPDSGISLWDAERR